MALWYLLNEEPEYRERIRRENNPFEDCWHCGRPSRDNFDVFSPLSALSQLDPFYSIGRRHRHPRERYFKVHDNPAQASSEENSATGKATQEKPKTCKDVNGKEIQEKKLQMTEQIPQNMLNLKEVFPFIQRPDGPFEMKVHLGDCDPDKLKVEFKNGLLKVEGRHESPDGSFSFVRHERTLPKGVNPSTLKVSLLPGGTLKIRQHLDTVDIPVTMEKEEEKSIEEDPKKQKMQNGDTEMEES